MLTGFLLSCNSSPDLGPIEFQWPLKKWKRLSQEFGGRHKGIDLAARRNTPIYASESGWVTYRGTSYRGYGKLLIVEHSKTWSTFYAHLNKYAVKQKQYVKKGQLIGYVGRTGRATGDHLHFEMRYNTRPVNPLSYVRRP